MKNDGLNHSEIAEYIRPVFNEQARLDALYRYRILDTAPEKNFDHITLLATQLFKLPIALISFVDESRVWFKSKQGVDFNQIAIETSFCASAIQSDDPYILNNACDDLRSKDNPLVAGEYGLRFYAGVPLKTSDGKNIGVLSVVDFEPRMFSQQDIDLLQALAKIVMDQLELNLSIDILNEVHQADNKFRLTFEKLADPMLLLDPDSGHFVDCNPAAIRMLAFPSKHDLQVLRPSDISPPIQPDGSASEEKATEMMAIALANGSHRFEWVHCSPYREPFPVEVLLTLIQINARAMFITTWRDISEQKHAQEELLESELRLKFALEGAGDGVWDWDISQSKVSFSLAWKSMLGYEDGDIEDSFDEWSKRVHPDDIKIALRDLENHLHGLTSSYVSEYRLLCKDGSYKWILDRGKSVSFDETGKPVRAVGIHTDITDHKNALEALKASEQNNNALLSAMVDGVFVAQRQCFIFANEAMAAMLGYTHAEFIGLHFDKVVAPDFLDIWTTRYKQRLDPSKHPVRQYEVRFLKKGATETLWVEVIASRVLYKGESSVLGIIRDITEKKRAEKMIWNQANFDFLTGLPNRHFFLDRLDVEVKKSNRLKAKMAVMFIDLDHFKEINDSLGHDAGDAVLKEASLRLQGCVRDTDMVSRLGGDEFTIILTDLDESNVSDQRAQSILKAMEEPFNLNNELAYISASIGITVYPDDTQQAEDLLKFADQAMYHAKKHGRNRFSYYAPSMQKAAVSKMHMISDMHQAIKNNEFYLLYQPIVDLESGKAHKAESLIRWNHPQRGVISPADFIPLAEETGLINEIGQWVFRESVRCAQHLRADFDETFQISINTSPVQYRNEDKAYPSFDQLIKRMNADGNLVVIEITESMLMDAVSINTKLYALRDAGIEVALDDFGTGYSSLSYLKKFDIDYLKIDQSFVRGLTAGSSDHALCEAIIVMAHKLEMKVIAEGVETEEQKALLAAAGCDYGQGYLFAKPLSMADFESFIHH